MASCPVIGGFFPRKNGISCNKEIIVRDRMHYFSVCKLARNLKIVKLIKIIRFIRVTRKVLKNLYRY